jgi:hypothetical protein
MPLPCYRLGADTIAPLPLRRSLARPRRRMGERKGSGMGDSDRKPVERPEPAPRVAARIHGAEVGNEKTPRIVPASPQRADRRGSGKWTVRNGGRITGRRAKGAAQLIWRSLVSITGWTIRLRLLLLLLARLGALRR